MAKNRIGKIYYIIIPFLIVGISLRLTTFTLSILALLPLLFFSDRHTVGFFLVMYGGPVGGITRMMYPALPIYGLLLRIIGFMLVRDLVVELFKTHGRAFVGMFSILLVFGLFYLIGPKDDWAWDKYSTMCVNGLLMVIGYYVLDKSKTINAERLCQILLVAAICMMIMVVTYYHLNPGSILDYNWFRMQAEADSAASNYTEHYVVSYQHIGMLIVYGAAIYLSQTKLKLAPTLFYFICAFHFTMMTGCRQAILAILVVVVLRIVVFRNDNVGNKKVMSKFAWIAFGSILAYVGISFFIENTSSEFVTRTLESGDLGREMLYAKAFAIFLAQPIFGSGIGGFHAITGDNWPHNMILEMLCEVGIVGTLSVLIIVLVSMFRKRIGLLHITKSDMFYFLILIALFVRVMVSSDLPESIELFSAVFAISSECIDKKLSIAQFKQLQNYDNSK